PILLVRVLEPSDVSLVRQVLRAQEYWRLKGLSSDVVVLNEHPSGYRDEMHEQLEALIDSGPRGAWKQRQGGMFLLRGDGLGETDRILLSAVARAILSGDRGEIDAMLNLPYDEPALPPALAASSSELRDDEAAPVLEAPPPIHANGRGGFTRDGREYTIVLDGADETPLP